MTPKTRLVEVPLKPSQPTVEYFKYLSGDELAPEVKREVIGDSIKNEEKMRTSYCLLYNKYTNLFRVFTLGEEEAQQIDYQKICPGIK